MSAFAVESDLHLFFGDITTGHRLTSEMPSGAVLSAHFQRRTWLSATRSKKQRTRRFANSTPGASPSELTSEIRAAAPMAAASAFAR